MGKIKFIILAMVICLVSGCIQRNAKEQTKEPAYQFANLLDSLLKKNPNVLNNDITKQSFADSLTIKLQQYRGDSIPFLSELPFQYEMCIVYPPNPFDFESEAYKNAGKYVVKFAFGVTSSKCKVSENYELTFQIFTIMDKSQVANLIDNNLYFINGAFVDFANNSQETGFVLPSGKCLVSYPSVSKSVFDSSKPSINLGTMILENVSFKPIGNEKVNKSPSNRNSKAIFSGFGIGD